MASGPGSAAAGPGLTGARAYDAPIRTAADLERLRVPRWHHDAAETGRRLNADAEALGDALPVRLSAVPPIFPAIARNATDLIGLDGLLLNMAAEPAFVHRLMAYLRDWWAMARELSESLS